MSNPEKNQGKIITDEDWKTQAQREKEKLQQKEKSQTPHRPAGTMPPANFMTLINSVMIQTLYCLGQIEDPNGGVPPVNLDLAKHHIDMLQVIEDKTKGNLSEEEAKALAMALHEVRLQFVQAAQNQ